MNLAGWGLVVDGVILGVFFTQLLLAIQSRTFSLALVFATILALKLAAMWNRVPR